jgi:hypothetical protein
VSATYSALLGGLLFGIVSGALGGLRTGTAAGVGFGLVIGLLNGGHAWIQHLVLRAVLWCNDFAPWNYLRFLDSADKSMLLRKVGGGYMFEHTMVQEYLASLEIQPDRRRCKGQRMNKTSYRDGDSSQGAEAG